MIIKGNPAGATGWWIKHLTRTDTNERVELKEVRGLLGQDVRSALWEMEAVASGSRSEGNFMYMANMSPRGNERLTEEQWGIGINTLEKHLGLEGHQRIVVEHEKDGRAHRHIAWNRVDVDTMRVTDMGGNYFTHQRVARELEERFNLTPTRSLHGERRPNGRPERAPELWEQDAKIDREKVKADLTEAWRSTDSGKAFKAAIEEKGYILANGERRAFIAVDGNGKPHSLARRIEGATAAQVKHRLADIDRETLPSVPEARERQKARANEPERSKVPAPERATESERKPEEKRPAPRQEPRAAEIRRPAPSARAIPEDHREQQPRPQPAPHEARRGETRTHAAPPAPPRQPAPQPPRQTPDSGRAAGKAAIEVADAAGKAIGKLGDIIGSLFGGGSTSREPPQEKHGHAAALRQMQEQRRANQALERIRDSMERGHRIRAEDLQNLAPNHIENIRAKGDDGLRALIDRHEQERRRARDDDWGRTRER